MKKRVGEKMHVSQIGGHSLTDHVYFGDHISEIHCETTQIIEKSTTFGSALKNQSFC